MPEQQTYNVRLGCMACGAINTHGEIPVETHWFDHFKKGVECDNCQCVTAPNRVTLWWANFRHKTGPFGPDELADIRRDARRPVR